MPPQLSVRAIWVRTPGARTFTTTPTLCALGPESPNYIDVPKPLQPTTVSKPFVKGNLPVPRDVFKTRSKIPKESEEFIAASIPDAKKLPMPGPYSRDAEYRLYKQRLADVRKQAFRAGVQELHERKVTSEAARTAFIQRSHAERRALAMAPPRPVDVLTQTSTSKGVRDFLENKLPSVSREEIAASRRKPYQKRMKRQDAVRRSRLHDLYTNAREFIVSEEQLDEAIEEAFGTDEEPVRWDVYGKRNNALAGGLSPWEGGIPEGVGEKLQKLRGGEGVGLAKERARKVAEVLTGGKM